MKPNESSRREFIQTVGCLAGALAAMGISRDVLALPIGLVEGTQAGNDRVYPIPSADGVTVDHAAQVILVRENGHVFALSLACPHQGAAVRWVPQHNQFECTKHDSHYEPDGLHVSGRATRNMDRFPVRKEGASLHVDIAHVYQSDKDPGGWASAAVAL